VTRRRRALRRLLAAALAGPSIVTACGGDGSSPATVTPASAVARAAASTVGVTATACGTAVSGSGFVAGDGLVVTAAHVVAGVTLPTVVDADGVRTPAEVVAFDPVRDLAVLSVDDPPGPPLALREPETGALATVVARTGDGALRTVPVTVATVIVASGPDIHGQGTHEREVAVLAGGLRAGDSGAPVVAGDGAVLAVVFATSTGRPDTAYAVRPAEVEAAMAAVGPTPVPTGPCVGPA
jgi:S1-C subfamily serine protease